MKHTSPRGPSGGGLLLFLVAAVTVIVLPAIAGPSDNVAAVRANTDLVVNEFIAIARESSASEGGLDASVARWQATADALGDLGRRVPTLLQDIPEKQFRRVAAAAEDSADAFERLVRCAEHVDHPDRFELTCETAISVARRAAAKVTALVAYALPYGWISLPADARQERVGAFWSASAGFDLVLRAPEARTTSDDESRYVSALRAALGRSTYPVGDHEEAVDGGYGSCTGLGLWDTASLARNLGALDHPNRPELWLTYQAAITYLCPHYAIKLSAIRAAPAINFGSGTWTIGSSDGQVAPDTWTAEYGFSSPKASCRWSRLAADGSVVATGHDLRVTIDPTDARFETQSCGTWSRAPLWPSTDSTS